MLEVQNLSLKYPSFSLNEIHFKVELGERISILGLSGSGKSSLLKSIYGLFDLNGGEVLFQRERVLTPSEVLIPGHKKMKLVDQNFDLDNYHSVRENISNKILHLEKQDIQEKTDELLAVVNMEKYQDQLAHTLSGGQKQRLALARALAQIPELLLLDEPFSQIDLMNKYEIEKRLFEYLDEYQITTIMVTHDFQDAFTLSNRILIMENGAILNDLDKKELYDNPSSHYEAMITGGYNEIQIENKTLNFRKNEFRTTKSEAFSIQLDLKLVDNLYLGAKYLIRALTKNGEEVSLESSTPLENTERIFIQPKKYTFAN
ncbi:MAG: ATP-binding cassette domain-containing protein [Crocinitomicaceae bacterium]|nr:ATP-binding cassette domain-containing protein [Crocinitomicaceae bacterium]